MRKESLSTKDKELLKERIEKFNKSTYEDFLRHGKSVLEELMTEDALQSAK